MIDLLRGTPLLSRLSDSQLQRVSTHAVRHHLDEGQWLFSQGDPARRFYLVEKGQIRLFRLSPEGAEKVIEIVSPGQTFAEALMFLNTPRYPVCAAALAPVELIAIDARDFARMLRESVDTCFVVLGALSQRLRALIGEIDNLTLHTAKSRVARYLVAHCPEDRRAFELDVRKGVLASRLSVKPETFSRVIKQLTLDGAIEVHGAHITILDREILIDLAELAESKELEAIAPGVSPETAAPG
jgi:CRP-like cAMP-binding protein